MKINGTSGADIAIGGISMDASIGGQTDPMVRDLQRQIEDLKNQMKELSSNPELSLEMKSKKRQELQKQISDLEVQLRQRQMEVKREEAIKKRTENYSMDEMLGTRQQTGKSDKQSAGLPTGSMEAMISADVSMKQADIHGSTSRKMEGRARVLEAEIKQDSAIGAVPAWKEEALSEVRAKANEEAAAQMGSLAQANKAVKEAAEADKDQSTDKIEDDHYKGTAKADEEKKEFGSGAAEDERENTFDTEQLSVPSGRGYQSVDIRL